MVSAFFMKSSGQAAKGIHLPYSSRVTALESEAEEVFILKNEGFS